MTFATHHTRRRGVLLLVILGLLAMFAMLAVSFILLTGQARRTAEAGRRIEAQSAPAADLLDEAFAQVVRGSNNPGSAIGPHSLLEDMYGTNSRIGVIPGGGSTTWVPNGANTLLEFAAQGSTDPSLPGVLALGADPNLGGNEYLTYVGSVLTMLNGPYSGASLRIVGANPAALSGGQVKYQVLMTDEVNPTRMHDYLTSPAGSSDGIRYVVNGAPFAGSGFGMTTSGSMSDLALRPFDQSNREPISGSGTPPLLNPRGGANEDYDAPDYQNMLLAMAVPAPERFFSSNVTTVPIPSLHRPELARHWQASGATEKYKYMARPMAMTIGATAIHASFTGSNPTFPVSSNTTGQDAWAAWDGLYTNAMGNQPFRWDVDNDGDGVADSVWVDLGLPVRSTADGRLYKPLFAILCLDLDGRLNLNAHGCPLQASNTTLSSDSDRWNYYGAITANLISDSGYLTSANSTNFRFAGNVSSMTMGTNLATNTTYSTTRLPRGLGAGPAEVNLSWLFANVSSNQTVFSASPSVFNSSVQRILMGNATNETEGRYGDEPGGGVSLVYPKPGVPGAINALAWNKGYPYAGMYYNPGPTATRDAYGSPPDLDGNCAVALDAVGRPFYWRMGEDGSHRRNTPYELNLNAAQAWRRHNNRQVDNPFTPAELEKILRPYDADSPYLANRFTRLFSNSTTGATSTWLARRCEVTTESWDTPTPSVAVPSDLSSSSGGFPARHIVNLLRQRMGGSFSPSAALTLLGPDLLSGLRLNVNRPLGNARDDNNNSIVDEPSPSELGMETMPDQYGAGGTPVAGVTCDPRNGSTTDVPREVLARNLYCLACLVCDTASLTASLGTDSNGVDKGKRLLAQWAVNVVDFMDRDSIMTRFAFDENPFDGWQEPADPAHVVWGCERPELIMTETMAFHDRRTEDTANEKYSDPLGFDEGEDPATYPDVVAGKTTDNDDDIGKHWKKDNDFDQRKRPAGSLFVELYNPGNYSYTTTVSSVPYRMPGDKPSADMNRADSRLLPVNNNSRLLDGVDPCQTTSDDGTGDPVWRILVGAHNTFREELDRLASPTDIDRAIYFAKGRLGGATTYNDGATLRYYVGTTTRARTSYIKPGRYCLVGPRDDKKSSTTNDLGTTDHVSYFGFKNGGTQGTDVRCMWLNPDLNPETVQAKFFPSGTAASNEMAAGSGLYMGGQPVVAVVVDQAEGTTDKWARLSVSESREYPNANDSGEFDEVHDWPLDREFNLAEWKSTLRYNKVHPAYRVLYLQRLANPQIAWDPLSNPYRTVDMMQVDLATFNGLENATGDMDAGQEGWEETSPFTGDFCTRERMKVSEVGVSSTVLPNVLWRTERDPSAPNHTLSPTPAGADHVFSAAFTHSFGRPNRNYNEGQMINESSASLARYNGWPKPADARAPVTPWLTWNNRPFVSQLELMLVPWTSSAELLTCCDIRYQQNPYDVPAAYFNANSPAVGAEGPFRYLLPYFDGRSSAGKFARIFDYLRVPSPFVGTEIQASPTTLSQVNTNHWFHPPFNHVSTYREPGRVNLNTITSFRVFRGLLNADYDTPTATNYARAIALWEKLVYSRRGYPSTFTSSVTSGTQADNLEHVAKAMVTPDTANLPTRFARPFRSSAGAHLAPSVSGSVSLRPDSEDEVTIFRREPQENPPSTLDPYKPLFAFSSYNSTVSSFNRYNDSSRNPFFRYQSLMRLGNLFTTRSNVYAVWITVGFFEVKRINDPTAAVLEACPDGYELGMELGLDSGEVRRHRGFYIFDRSIPVGFVRGENLNFDKATLLRRHIE